jgi:hypothetical protein
MVKTISNSARHAAPASIILSAAAIVSFASIVPASADAEAKFTWMLPRTVLDATIVYTFVNCDDQHGIKVAIKPTLVSRPVPDTGIGALDVSSTTLESWSSDNSVTIKTYQGSHLLQSIGATPVSQAATIASNILSGIGKIVALALGVAPAAVTPTHNKCGSAWSDKDKIEKLRDKLIKAQQDVLEASTDELRKSAAAKVEAYQTVLTSWSTASATVHSLTLQATIDPGFTPIEVLDPAKHPTAKPVDINPNGLIATIIPTQQQIEEVGWVKKGQPIDLANLEKLKVNIYLDFGQTLPIVRASTDMARRPTRIDDGDGNLYREVAYIPVYIYAGKTVANWSTGNNGLNNTWPGVPRIVTVNAAEKNEMLAPPQRLPFPQYGRAMGLPVTARFLRNLDWSIAFQENGEITETKFVNKSIGAAATSVFNTVAGGLNSIAAERRAADAANSETTRLTAENKELEARINNLKLQEELQERLAKQSSPSQASSGGALQ